MEFIQELNLANKLLPNRNSSITWFYVFLPALIGYFALLTTHINTKNVVGSIELIGNKNKVFTIFPRNVKVEEIATGHSRTDGPLVIEDESSSLNYLIFSDSAENRITRWEEGKGLFTVGESRFIENSGCGRHNTECQRDAVTKEIGTAGIVRLGKLDATAAINIITCQYGERAVSLLFENGTRVPLATHADGKRLNHPRDLVWSDLGHLYFTDSATTAGAYYMHPPYIHM